MVEPAVSKRSWAKVTEEKLVLEKEVLYHLRQTMPQMTVFGGKTDPGDRLGVSIRECPRRSLSLPEKHRQWPPC